MASKVIIIDPWWNSAAEQQAFCRVFRIGQKQETFMVRLCVKDTVDVKIIGIQARKDWEIKQVMGRYVHVCVCADCGVFGFQANHEVFPGRIRAG